ncbi:hypothetical protein [Herbaspirillum huttiense]|uniref:SGNH/GDSL hydrolase family protein n=1 Tax=Herbaspirillum huttiense subsp. lycopersici TaxID=3074428 RepID=A0ABU2EGI4_9BURK|nr:hypothetical protein [Herbaspirillum huttiense]MDR9846993.1 hypothetical protein [Herbaspirillum huttiense SE1]
MLSSFQTNNAGIAVPVSKLRQNSTHCRYANILGGVKEWFGYSLHQAQDDLSWSRVGFTNYVGKDEVFNTGTLALMTGLEYPVGRDDLQMYSYQGTLMGSTPGGGDILSDQLIYDTVIPKGAWYKLWHFHQSTTGIPFFYNGPQPFTNDNRYGLSIISGTVGSLINYLASTSTAAERMALANTNAASNQMIAPICIVSDTKVRSIGILGDSRTSGQAANAPFLFDYASDATLNACIGERLYGPMGAWINLAASGDSATSFTGGNGGRRANYLNYVTDVVNGFGTNDFQGAVDSASLIALDAKLKNMAQVRKKKFWGITVPPKTTSTDQWSTLANQTVVAGEQRRLDLNSYRRSRPAIYDGGILDSALGVEDSATGKWKVSPNAHTVTGSMTVGSNSFAASSGTFSNLDTGKTIVVLGAGASAGVLAGNMVYVDDTHVNIVDAVTGAAVNATTAVTNGTAYAICREFTGDGIHETQRGARAAANIIRNTIASQNVPNHAILSVGSNSGVRSGVLQQEASGEVVAVRLCIASKTLANQVLPQFKAIVATSDTAGGNTPSDTWQPNVGGVAYPAPADAQGRGWVPVTFNGGQLQITMPPATGETTQASNAVIRSDRIVLPSRSRKNGETGGPMYLARIEQTLANGQWTNAQADYSQYVASFGQPGVKVWRAQNMVGAGVSNPALNPTDMKSWYMMPFWFEFEYAAPHYSLIVSGDSRFVGGGHPVLPYTSWAVLPVQAAALPYPIDVSVLGASGFSSSQYLKLVYDFLNAGGRPTHVMFPVHSPNDSVLDAAAGDAAIARADAMITTLANLGIKTVLSTGYACGYNGSYETQRQRMIQWAKTQAASGRVILFDTDSVISDTTTTPGTGVIKAQYLFTGDKIHCNEAGNTAMGALLASVMLTA